MGAANVIPGVSGGTIALITGIYEDLINSLKAFNLKAIQLLARFKWKEFFQHVNLPFLIAIFAGIAVSIVSLAKLFKVMMEDPVQEKWIMAFFFGLIVVSIYSVGKTIKQWNLSSIISLVIGLLIALVIAFTTPLEENASLVYLLVCGVAAICSMILPGLSGSFVLIILGNYKLIMLDAVSEFNMKILIPVAIGSVLGLVAFAQILGWVLKRYHDQTIALMTGFIIGSLVIIWPWKNTVPLLDTAGNPILKKGKEIISGYEWYIPDFSDMNTWIAVVLMVAGAIAIWAIERWSNRKPEELAVE